MATGVAESPLRVLFIVGGLGQGGAEKQLIYMLRALKSLGVVLRLISLTGGEFHEQSLEELGLHPHALGALNPPARLTAILREIRAARPHLIQATHFFASFYAGLAGRLSRTPSIGAIRGDFYHDVQGTGTSAKLIMRLPSVFLANSFNARDNAVRAGLSPARVHVLQNVIDLDDFDRRATGSTHALPDPQRCRVITVARLMPVKRLERFLHGLAIARREVPELEGVIVGGGPKEAALRQLAAELDLLDGGVHFYGERSDIPQLLAQANIFALTSEREGFPNVLLEAMAASLPVITTPAGECQELVQDGVNGYLVPFDDHPTFAARLVELARSPSRRSAMGKAGRSLVESRFEYDHLGPALMSAYTEIARQTRALRTENALRSYSPAVQSLGTASEIPASGTKKTRG
jgi:glycosyltransferase involved in cell wall biosynthesis